MIMRLCVSLFTAGTANPRPSPYPPPAPCPLQKLAEALKCGINDLPLSLDISWFEQKGEGGPCPVRVACRCSRSRSRSRCSRAVPSADG